MAANYNNAAWFYDSLSRVVYGNALIDAQVYLLQYIQPHSNILIVGGGTGWILEQITKLYPSGLHITYVEISDKMIALSCKRNVGSNQVNYINDAIENVNGLTDYDIIITPFLLDNFTPPKLEALFAHMHPMLKNNGVWLNTDFQLTGKWWQKVLLKSMLVLFKVICGVESTKLPDFEKQFEAYGYEVVEGKYFFGDFVASKIYKKSSPKNNYHSELGSE